jgi:MAF protein
MSAARTSCLSLTGQELSALGGWELSVRSSEVDETAHAGESGRELTRRLARMKVGTAPSLDGEVVLAADTIVVHQGELIGKPGDADEARLMLERLRGRSHLVVTSIALQTAEGTVVQDPCESTVTMRRYSDEEIERYLEAGGADGKAGAYGIQDGRFDPVDRAAFRDCFANVMGLPLCHVVRSLRRLGVEPMADVPAACKAHTGYDCRVHDSILAGEA